MKLNVSPAWKFTLDSDNDIDPLLFRLLRYLHDDPKLTRAAKHVNISYRHAWNILNKWNNRLEQPLVAQTKGQGTRLTLLGEKFIWAENLIEAQLAPGISTLTSTINRELNGLLGKRSNILQIYASHGYAIDAISKLSYDQDDCSIDIRYMGSTEAIESLMNEDCELAGFHICTHPLVRNNIKKHYRTLIHADYSIIKLVLRTQGLIVQKGNPKSILYLSDLTRPEIVFINRQKSAGTRILLDELLNSSLIDKNNITGYHNEEYTHTAVAAHVASGAADIGFGIEYAAHKFNLDFIPIVSEQYLLACKTDALNMPSINILIELIKSHEFAQKVCNLPGYKLDSAGTTISTIDFFK